MTARLGVDIGGTFTDVALETDGRRHTAKVLTTPAAPEDGVMAAIDAVLAAAGAALSDVAVAIHGTTLATNAIIERKGARCALITTEGFRDTVVIGTESRFEQYDVFMDKPPPLVPRRRRLTVPERTDAGGEVLLALDEAAVEALAPRLERDGVESVAIGFLHSFVNPGHERRARDILASRLPDLAITLSSEVSPEMREYERFSTACANAYVQPLMVRYLRGLERRLAERGFAGTLLMMLSGGGLATIETAVRFPVRLVESGPAGGAIFAGHVARRSGLDSLLSFDMGGTTAKICLIDGGKPQTARSFEVAREYRFLKGSGLPIRVPVIEMVEIGAGGGSIARLDQMRRITVGPDSAGAEPGPACYGRGGVRPTVTDADLVMGRIDADAFSGGRIALDGGAARAALHSDVGAPLELSDDLAAFGVGAIVDEAMASAVRVHAIESGKTLEGRTLVAFGGAAPLHAAGIAEKLGIDRVVVPANAGVGSAVGFLRAPVAYEIARSRRERLAAFDPGAVNALFDEMEAEAHAVVERAAAGAERTVARSGFMRYVGQGHEIAVELPARPFGADDGEAIRAAFEDAYAALYDRVIPGVDVEVLSWAVTVSAEAVPETPAAAEPEGFGARADGRRTLFDPASEAAIEVPVYDRAALAPGARVPGPAVIAEDETTTVVTGAFEARLDGGGAIVLERRNGGPR